MPPATQTTFEERSLPVQFAPSGRAHAVEDAGMSVVVDLCCGMGGLSLAARELGMRVAAGVDVNAHAARTFEKNFPDAQFIDGSVRSSKVLEQCRKLLQPFTENGTPSVVLSGPPCQGFSMAGSRDPVDPRNQILVAVSRAIAELHPHCALVENVSTVLNDAHSKRLQLFYEILTSAGYFIQSVLLDASDFGVPQKRRRAFFLITRTKLDATDLKEHIENRKCPKLNAGKALAGLPSPMIRPEDYDDEQDYGEYSNHIAMRHSKRVMAKIAKIEPGTGPMSYRKLHPLYPSNTLFSGHRAPPAHFTEPRSITVREAARLQGFPDDFRIYGSFGNQMQQVTNAVPPPLANAVLRVLVELAGMKLPSDA
jgi:DNA (cytosine-5)-methyltransferase 1